MFQIKNGTKNGVRLLPCGFDFYDDDCKATNLRRAFLRFVCALRKKENEMWLLYTQTHTFLLGAWWLFWPPLLSPSAIIITFIHFCSAARDSGCRFIGFVGDRPGSEWAAVNLATTTSSSLQQRPNAALTQSNKLIWWVASNIQTAEEKSTSCSSSSPPKRLISAANQSSQCLQLPRRTRELKDKHRWAVSKRGWRKEALDFRQSLLAACPLLVLPRPPSSSPFPPF